MDIKIDRKDHNPSKQMSTDNGVPRPGDEVEYAPGKVSTVKAVRWVLITNYEKGYITHQAVLILGDE